MLEENKSIQGTETEKNLREAFVAEATSLLKYVLFSKKTSFQNVKDVYMRTASNEKEHAEKFLELLGGLSEDDITNLKNSIALEGFVSTIEYPHAARVADKEGFYEIAKIFDEIAIIEERHKRKFESLLSAFENKTMLFSSRPARWVCMKCGYIYEGVEPPDECPVCQHDWKHFELYKEE